MKLSDFTLRDEQDELVHREQLAELLERANRTESYYPKDKTLPRIFVEHATKAPEAPAVIYHDVHLSYGELDRLSNHVARFLLDFGLQPEAAVGVMIDRSPAAIVGMMGALKSGGAYLPINPEMPQDRIKQMLRDSRAPVLIYEAGASETAYQIREECPDLLVLLMVSFEADRESQSFTWEFEFEGMTLDTTSVAEPVDRSLPGALSYLLYTSGTTGIPKGAMIEHHCIMRLVMNTNYVALGPTDRTLQMHSSAFDASIFEVWGALLNGDALCIPDLDVLLDASELARLIREHRITTVVLMTGLFNALVAHHLEVFEGLKVVITGGEKASAYHFNRLHRAYPSLSLINGYGPTENTTITTFHRAETVYEKEVPIGTPIGNTSVYLLDENLELVSIGEVGELCAGGDGVARGYLNDPVLTAQKFIPHPFSAGARLYRTGDLARWREDGTLDFLGRGDTQVKVRGYRIELGDIETRLLQYEPIRESVVADRTGEGDDRHLVAYFTASEQVDVPVLRAYLKEHLPPYMVPNYFVQIERMPLTTNNKVDRNALPDHRLTMASDQQSLDQPETETEKELLAIWQEVLERSDFGINQDFFELGGHSLDIVMLTHLIQQRLGFVLPFTLIFNARTIRELAQALLDSVTFGEAAIDNPLVPLGAHHGGPAVFAFPPGTADALGYTLLAEQLKPQSLYAFNFIEAESRLQDYADLIMSVDPVGPYRLFGYSGGGNLAFRTAKELEKRGKTVSDIVMLDTSRFLEKFQFPVNESRRLALEFLDADGVKGYIKNPLLRDKVVRTIDRYYDYLSGTPDNDIVNANIHVITSENSPDNYYDEDGRLACSKSGWAHVTRGEFRMYQGQGDHRYMLHRQYLEGNASILREIFQAVAAIGGIGA